MTDLNNTPETREDFETWYRELHNYAGAMTPTPDGYAEWEIQISYLGYHRGMQRGFAMGHSRGKMDARQKVAVAIRNSVSELRKAGIPFE